MADDKSIDAGGEDAPVEEQASMDDVIEAEAEKEASAERTGEGGEEENGNDDTADDDSDSDADGETNTDDAEAEAEAEDELEDEAEDEEEESESVDTSQFGIGGLEAVPDDYKPQDWKGFMNDVVEVVRGEVNKEAQAINQQQAEFQQEVQSIDQGWQSEIDELVKAGDIPKGKDQDKAVQDVFNYMAETNKRHSDNPSKQIWSFETAYKLMNANKVTDERKSEIKARRNQRAAATAGSSEGGSGMTRPIKGMTMDDIIEQEFGG